MATRTIRDVESSFWRGRRVFVRVDFNVPITAGPNGTPQIGDDTRIQGALPTIKFLLEHGATVILASHLGRPKGKPNPAYSLKPVADHLQTLLGRPVAFATDCIGAPARNAEAAHRGGVVLLENLRFHAEEEANDPDFARELASLCDAYVNDAFGSAHRAHASTEGITHFVKDAVAGFLMAAEVEYLGKALNHPDRPFVAILGGAKVSDKLEVIENLLTKVDALLIGGAMAYTFFKAQGLPVGKSLVEPDLVDTAKDILARAGRSGQGTASSQGRPVRFELPVDHVVATSLSEPSGDSNRPETLAVTDAAIGERMGLDIGPKTIDLYARVISGARTVVWNGPMGVFEIGAFAAGTIGVANAVAAVKGTTIIGGGDSVAAVHQAGVADKMTHISTGGGASLEFLGGQTLPGVAALNQL